MKEDNKEKDDNKHVLRFPKILILLYLYVCICQDINNF